MYFGVNAWRKTTTLILLPKLLIGINELQNSPLCVFFLVIYVFFVFFHGILHFENFIDLRIFLVFLLRQSNVQNS